MTVCGNRISGVCSKCKYFKLCHNAVWDKTPHKQKTNEEWLKQADTEELVDCLYEHFKGGASVERQMWIEERKERFKMQIRGWLKSEHKE